MTKSERFRILLSKGYFPEELPPPFVTDSFAKHRNAIFKLWNSLGEPPKSKFEVYSNPRVQQFRRTLALVNPVAQIFVARLIADNWVEIRKHLRKSRYSLSVPEIVSDGIRAVPKPDFEAVARASLKVSSNFNHVLLSDISRFYGTLYTHTLPWAISGKNWCKQNLHKTAFKKSLGNHLDIAVRKSQDNQTIGIPVGPDTSRILSEIVAVAVDDHTQMHLNLSSNQAFRYVDDWYIGFDSYGESELAIETLATSCREFELEINTEKTKILHASANIDSQWPEELRGWKVPSGKWQASSLSRYFNLAFSYSIQNTRDNVLDFAIKRTSSFRIEKKTWDVYESYLLKSVRTNETCLPAVAKVLVNYNLKSFPLEIQRIKKIIDDIVTRNAPLGRHGEVAWALFLAKALRIQISTDSARVLSQLESSVCALIALDIRQRGQIPKGLNLNLWKRSLNRDGLHSKMWLLAYESDVKGWLASSSPGYVSSDPYFSVLKKKRISFYSETKNVERLGPPTTVQARGLAPASEEYGIIPLYSSYL